MSTAILAGTLKMGPSEKLNVGISFVNRLGLAETLSGSATMTLRDAESGQLYSLGLSGSASVSSPLVVQAIHDLISGHRYLLDVSVSTSQGQILEGQVLITCEGSPHLT